MTPTNFKSPGASVEHMIPVGPANAKEYAPTGLSIVFQRAGRSLAELWEKIKGLLSNGQSRGSVASSAHVSSVFVGGSDGTQPLVHIKSFIRNLLQPQPAPEPEDSDVSWMRNLLFNPQFSEHRALYLGGDKWKCVEHDWKFLKALKSWRETPTFDGAKAIKEKFIDPPSVDWTIFSMPWNHNDLSAEDYPSDPAASSCVGNLPSDLRTFFDEAYSDACVNWLRGNSVLTESLAEACDEIESYVAANARKKLEDNMK